MDLESKAQNAATFGPTYVLHKTMMAILWGPGINLTIVLAMYSYRKYYVYIHILFGAFIALYSIATALPIFIKTGIMTKSGKDDVYEWQMYLHFVMGLTSIFAVLVQGALGAVAKIGNVYQLSSSAVVAFRYGHVILGYLVSLLSKSNVYIIYWNESDNFWLFFAQDILFAALIVARKVVFPKMERVIVPKNIARNAKQIKAYKSLS